MKLFVFLALIFLMYISFSCNNEEVDIPVFESPSFEKFNLDSFSIFVEGFSFENGRKTCKVIDTVIAHFKGDLSEIFAENRDSIFYVSQYASVLKEYGSLGCLSNVHTSSIDVKLRKKLINKRSSCNYIMVLKYQIVNDSLNLDLLHMNSNRVNQYLITNTPDSIKIRKIARINI